MGIWRGPGDWDHWVRSDRGVSFFHLAANTYGAVFLCPVRYFCLFIQMIIVVNLNVWTFVSKKEITIYDFNSSCSKIQ